MYFFARVVKRAVAFHQEGSAAGGLAPWAACVAKRPSASTQSSQKKKVPTSNPSWLVQRVHRFRLHASPSHMKQVNDPHWSSLRLHREHASVSPQWV